jgi:hypothetical protein
MRREGDKSTVSQPLLRHFPAEELLHSLIQIQNREVSQSVNLHYRAGIFKNPADHLVGRQIIFSF